MPNLPPIPYFLPIPHRIAREYTNKCSANRCSVVTGDVPWAWRRCGVFRHPTHRGHSRLNSRSLPFSVRACSERGLRCSLRASFAPQGVSVLPGFQQPCERNLILSTPTRDFGCSFAVEVLKREQGTWNRGVLPASWSTKGFGHSAPPRPGDHLGFLRFTRTVSQRTAGRLHRIRPVKAMRQTIYAGQRPFLLQGPTLPCKSFFEILLITERDAVMSWCRDVCTDRCTANGVQDRTPVVAGFGDACAGRKSRLAFLA